MVYKLSVGLDLAMACPRHAGTYGIPVYVRVSLVSLPGRGAGPHRPTATRVHVRHAGIGSPNSPMPALCTGSGIDHDGPGPAAAKPCQIIILNDYGITNSKMLTFR